MSVEETLEQRGSVYGEFGVQTKTVGAIVLAMANAYADHHEIDKSNANLESSIPMKLLAEWHYLAIKLARISVNPNHVDSYHDLAGYAMLIEKERMK